MSASEILGYSRSERFVVPERFDLLPANELTFALRLAVNSCEKLKHEGYLARFVGAYTLQEQPKSPTIPVVYVVTVDSESAARRIHQLVWNQNQTPFLIVESPSTTRLYSGFSFDREQDVPLVQVAKDVADQLERLEAFRAEAIDDGTIWKEWAHAVDPKQRVDEALLRDLEILDRRLQQHDHMDRDASHGLIGKYVYLNYLRHRGILSDKKLTKWGIVPDQIFSKHATLTAFHRVNDELQSWLNGSVFSLGEDSVSNITAHQLKLVARVFAGDSPVGMTEIQSTLFSVYDFSHIPIETLSCVYEQFLHDTKESGSQSRGKTLGAYYTPIPLADYVLSEMDRRHPLRPGMSVLDPSCGSGVFLVQSYRRLIEKQRRELKRELKATELRDLLTMHIFGIDRDEDACRVAELSLIMTLLDYIKPPDLENTTFKLPSLRDQNLFQGDFFDDKGTAFEFLSKNQFDWVVGNPPWAEVKGEPERDHEHYDAHRWMQTNKDTHPTSGNQIAEAFLWKAGNHLTNRGACGLVVLAMTWFKKEATTFRQRFFSERQVWCLANFANLAYVLFSGRTERPASVVFYENTAPDNDHVILTYAPFVAEQISNRPERPEQRLSTWNIVVSDSDLHEVDHSSSVNGDSLTWKIAMWGTSRDRKILERTNKNFQGQTIDSLQQFGIGQPCEGFQLRTEDSDDELEHHPELEGGLTLNMNKLRNSGRIFTFPASALGELSKEECFVRVRGGLSGLAASQPPHIVIDASRRFAVYSEEFIAIPPRQVGISGKAESKDYLRALSLFLSSDFARYHQFFYSPKWGIDESIADLSTLKALPVPLAGLTKGELREWADLHRELQDSIDHELLDQLNDAVFKLINIRLHERWLIEDFVELHMQLNKGKFTKEVSRSPNSAERSLYLTSLRDCLDGYIFENSGMRHKLQVLADRESALIAISLVKSKSAIEPLIGQADDPASTDLKIIRDNLRQRHSQWVYFDRKLKVYDSQRGVLYQFKPLQRLHWTRRQAVLDADDIIAETLSSGEAS